MSAVRKILCMVFLVAGIGIFLFPEANSWRMEQENARTVEAFDAAVDAAGDAGGASQEKAAGNETDGYPVIVPSEALLEQVRAYNLGLWENGQAGFCDAWAAAQDLTVEGLDSGMFGYIEIPAMDTVLPLYVGASTDNLAKGAAILGATSLPVGGANTNSVIAAHRGYRGIPFFREIEKLGPGDAVYITNPWRTLGYRVESIDIISPTGAEQVMIQEGRDMVTLMTCHPYRSRGKYRYVVYCVRDDSVLTEDAQVFGDASGDGCITASDGTVYETSGQDIRTEKIFRCFCGILLLLFFIFCLIRGRKI